MHESAKGRAASLLAGDPFDDHSDVWQYRSDLERLARFLCRHPQDAEDVAHDTLLKAAGKLDGFRGEAGVKTWLHAIATNECRMLRRRRQPSSLDQILDQASEGEISLMGESVDPEDLITELETRREILAAILRLPERHRCVLMLKEGRGLPLEEVASLMDTTVPAIKSLLYRARATLRSDVGGSD